MEVKSQKEKNRSHYLRNREKIKRQTKAYYFKTGKNKRRLSVISKTGGGAYTKLNKRPYTGYCEVCGKIQENRLVYHHWDNSKPSLGVWICIPCHWFVEGVERGLQLRKYLDLKEQINNGTQA